MRIEVEKLEESGEPFARTYAPEDLQLGDDYARTVAATSVAGRASKKRGQVSLQGTINASVEVPCDRCLTPVVIPVNTDFDLTYIPAQAAIAEPEATELQEDDLILSVYEDDSIDVDEMVREQILLALPSRQLCREDCKGLCPTCGEDLNTQSCNCEQQEIDPRWSALAALKNGDG
jgi:uncharacterized protein